MLPVDRRTTSFARSLRPAITRESSPCSVTLSLLAPKVRSENIFFPRRKIASPRVAENETAGVLSRDQASRVCPTITVPHWEAHRCRESAERETERKERGRVYASVRNYACQPEEKQRENQKERMRECACASVYVCLCKCERERERSLLPLASERAMHTL